MEVSTSILNVEKENSVKTFYRIETAHTDYYHIDVMDGIFVENNTTETMKQYVDNLKNISNIPLDIHLMVKDIKKYLNIYIPCNPRILSFHIEAMNSKEETLETIESIKKENCMVGLAINPETEIEKIYEYLPLVHIILIMSVHPGKGGQKFIETTIEKIEKIKQYINENNLDNQIEVDGGINLDNVHIINKAGADIIVAGNAILNSKDYVYTINKLKCQ